MEYSARQSAVRRSVFLTIVLLVAGCSAYAAENPIDEGALVASHSAVLRVPLKSWKTLRDERVVKQDLDYSCGAASLATLLNGYYAQNLTEATLLKAMDKGDGQASFEDMARAMLQFGFKAQGFAANWEQLSKLRIPVIVYLRHRKDDHFSVIRGIDDNTVWLADPSLGNRTYSRAQFLAMWNTRSPADTQSDLYGKFLAILPLKKDHHHTNSFFTNQPKRQTAQAVQNLAIRSRL